MSTTFRARAVVLPDGVRPACITVRDGIIESVGAYGDHADIDIPDDAVLLPGLVDTHVHLNDPGRADWEGFASGTRAAAAGGITTLVDMPLNSIPAVTSVAGLEAKRAAAHAECAVDVAFWGGVVPGNVDALEPLWRAGVCGFKAFMSPSGVPEFAHVDEHDLDTALGVLARLGAPLLVHAELPAHLRECSGPRSSYASWLESRPDQAEVEAIRLLVTLAARHDARVHVVHVSSAESLPVLRDARRRGVRITAESCPHYLLIDAEHIADDATQLKCAPPIRSAVNREALWQGLVRGELDFIASDHSPAPPALKQSGGDWFDAWGGIASLQLGLPLVWTEARRRGLQLSDVVRWLATEPAALAGLHHRKGAIAPGRDADFVVFEPDAGWTVDASALYHRHSLTPYHGWNLSGRVTATWLRGERVQLTEPVSRSGRALSRGDMEHHALH